MKPIFNFDCIKEPVGKSDFQMHNKYTIPLPWHPAMPFNSMKKAKKFQNDYAIMCTKSFLEMMDIFNQLSQVYNRHLPTILNNRQLISTHANTAFNCYYKTHEVIQKFIIGYKLRERKFEGTLYVGNKLIDICQKLQDFIKVMRKELKVNSENEFLTIKMEQLNTIIKIVFCFGMQETNGHLDFATAMKTANKDIVYKMFFPWKDLK